MSKLAIPHNIIGENVDKFTAMRYKKTSLVLLISLFWVTHLIGQQINSIVFLPDSPASDDLFSIDVYTQHSSSDCPLVDSLTSVSISNDTIKIIATYEYGPMPASCWRNDTFPIGYLSPGIYFLHFELFAWNPPLLLNSKDTLVTVLQPASIKEKEINSVFIDFFPNPASKTVTISLSNGFKDGFSILIIDVLGKTVRIIRSDKNLRENEKIVFSTEGIAPGIYFISIIISDGQITKKLVINH